MKTISYEDQVKMHTEKAMNNAKRNASLLCRINSLQEFGGKYKRKASKKQLEEMVGSIVQITDASEIEVGDLVRYQEEGIYYVQEIDSDNQTGLRCIESGHITWVSEDDGEDYVFEIIHRR